MSKHLLLIPLLFITALSIAAAARSDSEPSSRFGPGKAVLAFDKEEGFQLSDKALKNLGVRFTQLAGEGPWLVPKDSIVRIKQSSGVYRRYETWISFILVRVIDDHGALVRIQSEDLQAQDEVAIAGAQFLRMTEADVSSGTVDNCAH